MAVTQQSDGNSIKSVEKEVEPSRREGADGGSCGHIQLRKSDGPSTGPRDIKKNACGKIESYKTRQNRDKNSKSENLSDIDDAEIAGYLNTKEEIHLKRILWEVINGKCSKAKKQKRTTETKKGLSLKKAAETTEEFKGRSSKINYDALKILNDELEQSSEMAEITGADSYAHTTENSPNDNLIHGRHGSNKFNYKEEDQHDISYCRDNETFGESEVYYGYGDEDEYFDS